VAAMRTCNLLAALALLLASVMMHIQAAKDMKFYNILGVSSDASEKELKKGYRKAALCAPACAPLDCCIADAAILCPGAAPACCMPQ
jgi:hypothetical protein